MRRTIVAVLCAALVMVSAAFADDGFASGFGDGFDSGSEESGGDGFSDGFGGGFDSGFGDNSGEEGSDDGFGSFGGSFGSTEESSSPLRIGGELSLPVRAYVVDDDRETESDPEGSLELEYESGKTAGIFDFSVTRDEVELNELSLTYYGSPFIVEAGYMKRVWGKGDEYHVINLMNPRNLEDFTNGGEYIEWIDPEVMLSVSVPVRQMGQIELLFSPWFTGDSIPASGKWSPYQADSLVSLAGAFGYSDADDLYPDTDAWDWSQFAAYYTDTFGSVDLGFMYYYGYYGEPAIDISYTGTIASGMELEYNRLQVFGMDMGAVIGPLNTRAELAYYMTEDYDGDDSEVYNNRIKWIAGFDVALPVSSLNVNIQETGTCILGSDEIEANDMEYDDDGDYTENLILLKISDSYNHEKVEASVTAYWHIEKQGWKIAPDVKVDLSDDLELEAEYCVFGGNDETSLLGQFDDNDYIEVQMTYSF